MAIKSYQEFQSLKDLSNSLDTFLKKFHHDFKLFDGGCAYAAYIIAEHLEENSLPFEVMVYHSGPNASSKNIHSLAKQELITHINIILDNLELGGDLNQFMDQHRLTKFKTKLTSEELWDLYESSTWNGEYDESHNEELEKEIELCFEMNNFNHSYED